ncbi:hypothetical protein HNR44_001478 [Geomicrobium halophilum]|uniref:Uncharacterized protein n=1 Tax=Geomicrobium halophilum TaxID=549000 RepID=A0A841PLA0_9BACL|nr:hypothetical protein [Geomicrobium halophilum]
MVKERVDLYFFLYIFGYIKKAAIISGKCGFSLLAL